MKLQPALNLKAAFFTNQAYVKVRRLKENLFPHVRDMQALLIGLMYNITYIWLYENNNHESCYHFFLKNQYESLF